MALSTVHTVEVCGHENSWSAGWADLAKTLHLARVIHLVELEDTESNLLVHVLLLLWGGVCLLLTLLTSSQQSQRDVELRVVRDTASSEASVILKLTSSEEHALLGNINSLAGSDGSLDVGNNGIGSEVQDLGTIYTDKVWTI